MANIFNHRKVVKNIINIISLATPLSRASVLLGSVVFLWLFPTNKLQFLPIRSVYKMLFNISPYSTGMIRGLSKLLHGDFYGAYTMNNLSYLVLLVILLLIIRDVYYLARTKDFRI